jgi:hypothetical protein
VSFLLFLAGLGVGGAAPRAPPRCEWNFGVPSLFDIRHNQNIKSYV